MKTLSAIAVFLLYFGGAVFSQAELGGSLAVMVAGGGDDEKRKVDAVYRVSEEGTINLPFIGKMKVDGLEPERLAKKIEDAYREAEVFQDAMITVHLFTSCRSEEPVVHVGGEVLRPGPQRFREGLTVFEVVQKAGKHLLGVGPITLVNLYRDGEKHVIDLTTPEGKTFQLKANDTVDVPRKKLFD